MVLVGIGGLVAAAVVFASGHDFAALAASRASARLGRPVTIAGLRLTPGLWLGVELTGLKVANLAGGTRPSMVEAERLRAEIRLWSLIVGPTDVRGLMIEGLAVLLERVDNVANSRLGPAGAEPAHAPDPDHGRRGAPNLLAGEVQGGEIDIRTTSGQTIRVLVDSASIQATDAGQPVRLTATGRYNDTPVGLTATLASLDALRDAATPYPADITLTAGADRATVLNFTGTMTDPLGLDGGRGRLSLTAPTPAALLAIAGADATGGPEFAITGNLQHDDKLWRLTDSTGTLAGEGFTAPLVQLQEGARGEADEVRFDVALGKLDLDRLLPGASGGGGDTPLTVSQRPDPRLDGRLSIRELRRGGLRATDVRLAATQAPGLITLGEVSLTSFGAQLRATGQLAAIPLGGRLTAQVTAADGNVEGLLQRLGVHTMLTGRLDGRAILAAEGATVRSAVDAGRLSAVLAVRGGRVAQEVVEMASTDIRLLFRGASGTTPLNCLLAVVQMRGVVGEAAPLRLLTGAGAVAGSAEFDLRRERLDLVIGSLSESTGSFALDVPVRVAGPFAAPTISPAAISADARARLAAPDDFTRLPADLRSFAQANACRPARR